MRYASTLAAIVVGLLGMAPVAAQAAPARIVDAPVITGRAQVGADLVSSPGTWTPADGVPGYRWLRCDAAGESCSDTGVEGTSYRVVAADAGWRLAVRLTVTWGTTVRTRSSEPTGVVTDDAPATPPVNVAPPTIGGVARAGDTLSVEPGTWSSEQPMTFSYGWERCGASGEECASVAGATTGGYLLGEADVGHALRAVVTATSAAGATTAYSAPTAAVEAAPPSPGPTGPVNSAPPTITGEAVERGELLASAGAWTGEGPYAFAYEWLRCDIAATACTARPGATGATYVVDPGDVGARLRVRVTATTPDGAAVTESSATAVVLAQPPEEQAPVEAAPAPAAPVADAAPAASPSAAALPAPAASPAPASSTAISLTPPRLMAPFPRIRIAGRYEASTTWLDRVVVTAPRRARIAIRCRGERCPAVRAVAPARARRLRFLERAYPASTVLEIRVTLARTVGKYVRISMRAGRAPSRRDACLQPGSGAPVACPGR